MMDVMCAFAVAAKKQMEEEERARKEKAEKGLFFTNAIGLFTGNQ